MRTEFLQIRISKEEKEWLKDECKKNFQSQSDFLRMLVANYRKENGGEK